MSIVAPPVVHLDLLRHPEVEAGGRILGRADASWSAAGRRQADAILAAAAGWPRPDRLLTSPTGRAARLAGALAEVVGRPAESVAALAEQALGTWEGRPAATLPPAVWADPVDRRPPGGESWREVVTRVGTWWEALPERRAGGRLLVVTHAGVVRALLVHLLGMPLAAAARCAPAPGTWTALSWAPPGGVLRVLGAPLPPAAAPR